MTDTNTHKTELPDGWVWATIDHIIGKGGLFYDGDWVESKDQDPDGNVRLIQLADVGDGIFKNRSNRFLTSTKAHELNCTYLKKGDVLVARLPDPLGRACIFPLIGDDRYVTVVDVCIVRSGETDIDPKFILFAINSPTTRVKIDQFKSGSTRKRISRTNLARIEFPLPPLPEQHRIVAKIEELFSDLDASVAALIQVQDQLRIYRQAVLKYAFEGRLTAAWREQHTPPPAADLLAQIKTERAARTRQQLADWQAEVKAWEAAGKSGRKPSKPRPVTELPPLSEEELAELPALPEGWVWVRVGDIGEVRLGRQRSPKRAVGPNMCQYMRAANVTWEGLNLTDIKSMDFTPEEQEIYRLKKGDVLLSEASGSASEVGKPAIWKEQIENCCFQNTLIRVRPDSVLSEYLHRHFFFDARTERFGELARGVGIHHLGANGMTNWLIALPSVIEQQAIVDEIDSRLSVVDKLDETIAAALQQAEALRQSILKQAFAGKLVPQDPSDEPASVLLERIRKGRKD